MTKENLSVWKPARREECTITMIYSMPEVGEAFKDAVDATNKIKSSSNS